MPNPFHIDPRRLALGAAKRYLLDDPKRRAADDRPPRLTPEALLQTKMHRPRERVLANLDEMYGEAFERAKAIGDDAQMQTLDFAYRREQLYFEILLDIRDAIKK